MQYSRLSTCRRVLMLLLTTGASLLGLHTSAQPAESKKDTDLQRERAEAAAEDEADLAKGEGFVSEKTFAGRLTLGQVVEGRQDIIGLFAIDDGKTYPVKLEDDGLLQSLQEYDQKSVTLQGKFRNQGKYFVVTAIIPPAPPTPTIVKFGGL